MRLFDFHPLLGAIVAVGSVLALCAPVRAQSVFDVTLNTTGLSGSAGFLAFDFLDGDGLNNNMVSITSFLTDAVLAGATNNNTGGASGDLPGDLSVTDSSFFNESSRGLTYGTSLSFRLTMSEAFAGGTPDQFSFFLLDALGINSVVATSDPTGANSVFVVDVTGSPGGSLQVFTTTAPGVSFQIVSLQSSAPEPGTIGFVGMTLVGLLLVKRTREKCLLPNRKRWPVHVAVVTVLFVQAPSGKDVFLS
jgi:hypothetical protein